MSDFDDIQALWKTQPVSVPEVDMTALKKKAHRFSMQVKIRNATEWLAAAFVMVLFLWMAAVDALPLISRLGAVLIALGAAYVAWRIYRDGRLRELPDAALDTHAYVEAYRGNLEAQAKLLQDVPRWYLGPLVPGMLTFFAGFLIATPAAWLKLVPVMAGCAAVFVAVGWLNRFAAKKLRSRAAELQE